MGILSNIEPKEVFQYFEELSRDIWTWLLQRQPTAITILRMIR